MKRAKIDLEKLEELLKQAIIKDHMAIVKVLIQRGVRVKQEHLDLAKLKNSKVVGRFLVNYSINYERLLKYLSQITVQDTDIPNEIMDHIARLSLN